MAYRKFSLFHLSLIEVRQPNFSTLRDTSREEWLRLVLGVRFEFPHFGHDMLHWVPQDSFDGLIIGVIERPRERLQHLPPEEGGGEITKQEWQGAFVVIDPTCHIPEAGMDFS